jgi:hypothetical protein
MCQPGATVAVTGDHRAADWEVTAMLKILIALVLFAHGVGHIIGPLQVSRAAVTNPSWDGQSWLLSSVTGTSLAQAVGVVLWLAAMIGFIALAAIVMGWLPQTWWVPLAIVSSVVSLAAIALFPSAFPTTSTIGAVVVDAAVLIAVLWFHWVPADVAA